MEKSRVPAQKAENRNREAEEFLPISDGLCGDETDRGAFDGIFEQASGFEVSLLIDDVVEASVLTPLEPHLRYASPLVELVKLDGLTLSV